MSSYGVSKVIVRAGRYFLMSHKRKRGVDNGRLEFLGGRHASGESPLAALVRELAEEEKTGYLSDRAAALTQAPIEIQVGGGHHFIFDISLPPGAADLLKHDPAESLGFELVSPDALVPGQSFTHKTNGILKVLNLQP